MVTEERNWGKHDAQKKGGHSIAVNLFWISKPDRAGDIEGEIAVKNCTVLLKSRLAELEESSWWYN